MKFKLSALLLMSSLVFFSFKSKPDQNKNALVRFYQLANASQASRAKSISKGFFADDWKSYGKNEKVEPGSLSGLLNFSVKFLKLFLI